ncbi:dCTP deaminase, dUMP-forming [uncultured archaeon]|nr:dCTP deaminase, dUMP-forming [uncultured archaeon]
MGQSKAYRVTRTKIWRSDADRSGGKGVVLDETKKNSGIINGENCTGGRLIVKIKILAPGAKMPKIEHEGDSGFDLYANEDALLGPLERKAICTGISIEIPQGFEGQVRPKSGLALEHGITMLNTPGTIDSGYRGEIKAVVINLGDKEYKIEKGKKICQLVFSRVESPAIVESTELSDSKRGKGGFGSTGLH